MLDQQAEMATKRQRADAQSAEAEQQHCLCGDVNDVVRGDVEDVHR
jgi:hypothetical protein